MPKIKIILLLLLAHCFSMGYGQLCVLPDGRALDFKKEPPDTIRLKTTTGFELWQDPQNKFLLTRFGDTLYDILGKSYPFPHNLSKLTSINTDFITCVPMHGSPNKYCLFFATSPVYRLPLYDSILDSTVYLMKYIVDISSGNMVIDTQQALFYTIKYHSNGCNIASHTYSSGESIIIYTFAQNKSPYPTMLTFRFKDGTAQLIEKIDSINKFSFWSGPHISNSGKFMANNSNSGLEIYSIDTSTFKLTLINLYTESGNDWWRFPDSVLSSFDFEFSPNDSFLYVSTHSTSQTSQTFIIRANVYNHFLEHSRIYQLSKYVSVNGNYTNCIALGLFLGYNGHIYMTNEQNDTIYEITNPNEPNINNVRVKKTYFPSLKSLAPSYRVDHFRNMLQYKPLSFYTDTICQKGIVLHAKGTNDYNKYQFYFGDGDTAIGNSVNHYYKEEGKYLVKLKGTTPYGYTGWYSDSVYFKPYIENALGHDTFMCSGELLQLDAGDGGNYIWNNGSTDRKITIQQVGIYWAIKDINFCKVIDTLHIRDTSGNVCGEKWMLKPNPADANISIWGYSRKSHNIQLSIYDLQGKKVLETANQFIVQGDFDFQFPTTNLSQGLYIINILKEDGIQSKMKFMIIR